jgi:hypothetical protein
VNITTATPVEIDTRLAELYAQAAEIRLRRNSAIDVIHHGPLGERSEFYRVAGRTLERWPTSTPDAIAAARALPADQYVVAYSKTVGEFLAVLDSVTAEAEAVNSETNDLDTEFDRRGGWSRFFTAQSSGGHIHRSMACKTCNKRGKLTEFGWNPELSGLDMHQAIRHFDRHAFVLCTVCFPDAPSAYTVREPDPNICPGAGKYIPGPRKWGECPVCHTYQTRTATGNVRKHNRPTAE